MAQIRVRRRHLQRVWLVQEIEECGPTSTSEAAAIVQRATDVYSACLFYWF